MPFTRNDDEVTMSEALEVAAESWPKRLLGKKVRVTLDRCPSTTIVTGQLLSFNDAGGFVVRDDDGVTQFCWPMLDIEEFAPATPLERDQAIPSVPLRPEYGDPDPSELGPPIAYDNGPVHIEPRHLESAFHCPNCKALVRCVGNGTIGIPWVIPDHANPTDGEPCPEVGTFWARVPSHPSRR